MEIRTYPTPLGVVHLRGEPEAFNGSKPVVLGITGAFAGVTDLVSLDRHLPEAAALIGHLPGNHCPPLLDNSVKGFAEAYSNTLDQIARPTIICGSSVGALVAMAMASPHIRGLVLLEPPLRTSKLWRTIPRLRARLTAPTEPQVAEFLWNVFGITRTTVADRNYLPLISNLAVPTWCVVGGVPLMPPREVERDTSLVDVSERSALSQNRNVRLVVAPDVGHNLPAYAGPLIVETIQTALREALP